MERPGGSGRNRPESGAPAVEARRRKRCWARFPGPRHWRPTGRSRAGRTCPWKRRRPETPAVRSSAKDGVPAILGESVLTSVLVPMVVFQPKPALCPSDDPGPRTVLADMEGDSDGSGRAVAHVHYHAFAFESRIGLGGRTCNPAFERLSAQGREPSEELVLGARNERCAARQGERGECEEGLHPAALAQFAAPVIHSGRSLQA